MPDPVVSESLSDFAAFTALTAAERSAVAAAVAAQLGPAFRAGDVLVGTAQLATVVHVATSEVFVLIPGGVFQMGFSDADHAAFTDYFPLDEHGPLHRALGRTIKLMRPVREVRVGPFALAQRPLETEASLQYFGGEPRAEPFSRAQADAVIAATGFRYPSEAEWEYVAREGRALSFLRDVAAVYFDGADSDPETDWGIAGLGQAVWVGDRWHPGYKDAPTDGTAWTKGRGTPMHRGSFNAGLDGMQDAHELVYALTALRQEPGIDDGTDDEVWLQLAFGPDAAGRWVLSEPVAPRATKTKKKPRPTTTSGADAAPAPAPTVGTLADRPADAGDDTAIFALMPAAPMVRALVERALTGGDDGDWPEVTWPLIIAAGLENVAWAREALPRVLASAEFSVRSIAHYAVVYPLALAGEAVEPSWTTRLNLVAPPESTVVWNGLRPDLREAAMVAAITRVLPETSVLNDALFFVRRYQLPALAEACLAYFTSKEGTKKHGRKTMSSWVYLLRKLCAEVPALGPVLPRFPAE